MKTLKTPEQLIQEFVGILPGAKNTTPMDYCECVKIILIAQREALETALDNYVLKSSPGLRPTNVNSFQVNPSRIMTFVWVDKDSILNLLKP